MAKMNPDDILTQEQNNRMYSCENDVRDARILVYKIYWYNITDTLFFVMDVGDGTDVDHKFQMLVTDSESAILHIEKVVNIMILPRT